MTGIIREEIEKAKAKIEGRKLALILNSVGDTRGSGNQWKNKFNDGLNAALIEVDSLASKLEETAESKAVIMRLTGINYLPAIKAVQLKALIGEKGRKHE